MNWNQLNYVLTIAKEKNISKAARKLYISQPSLSISLSQLEKEVGSALFKRAGNTLELTYAGELFCQWATTVLYSKDEMQERFKEIQNGTRERIAIGISPHRSSVLTPVLVKAIHESYPDCELRIVEKPNNELNLLLAEDELDMIIDIPQTDNLTYESVKIVEEEICIALPWEVGKEDTISLEKLRDMPFILLPEKSYFGKMSRQCLKEAAILPNVICECTFSETAKKLVENGIGAAFLPDIMVMTDQPSKNIFYYKIKDNKVKRTIAIVYKKEKHHSKQFKEIVEIFRECFLATYNRYSTGYKETSLQNFTKAPEVTEESQVTQEPQTVEAAEETQNVESGEETGVNDPYDLYSWDEGTNSYIPYQQAGSDGSAIGQGNGWYYYDQESGSYLPW